MAVRDGANTSDPEAQTNPNKIAALNPTFLDYYLYNMKKNFKGEHNHKSAHPPQWDSWDMLEEHNWIIALKEFLKKKKEVMELDDGIYASKVAHQ